MEKTNFRLRWPGYLAIGLFCLGVLAYLVAMLAPHYFERLRAQPVKVLKIRSGELGEIAFVHGWTGRQESWETMLNLVLRDARLDNWGVFLVDYDTVISGIDLHVDVKAKLIAEALRQKMGQKNVVVVAHSFGGVISRLVAIMNQSENQDRRMKIEGLITYGSPHGGIEDIPSWLRQNVSTETVRLLTKGGEPLAQLQSRWIDYSSRTPIKHVCVSGGADQVVSERSALFGCKEEIRIADKNHSGIIRPESADSPAYQALAGVILSVSANKAN